MPCLKSPVKAREECCERLDFGLYFIRTFSQMFGIPINIWQHFTQLTNHRFQWISLYLICVLFKICLFSQHSLENKHVSQKLPTLFFFILSGT